MHLEWRGKIRVEWVDVSLSNTTSRAYDYGRKYEISELGEVRNKKTRRILKWRYNPQGYAFISLHSNRGVEKQIKISRLMLYSFYGPPRLQKKYQGALRAFHKNGCRGDHRLSNLEWKSTSEIQKQLWKEGWNKWKTHRGTFKKRQVEGPLGEAP